VDSRGSYWRNVELHEGCTEENPMPQELIDDPHFTAKVLSATENPQQAIYAAMHQDYSEGFVYDNKEKFPDERRCGEIITRRLLKVSHFGPFEHPQIVFNVGYFPHSVMQQLRTHRNSSFDVQSGRYSGERFLVAATKEIDIEQVFYLRPSGHYSDRQGKRYFYSPEQRDEDKEWCLQAARRYRQRIEEGLSEEHARGLIPFDFRQHFVMSCNARSLMHILDLRAKADAQLEIQTLCSMLFERFKEWMPEVAEWYGNKRLNKGSLAP
jgi:thymidylate synthase (FAD)